MKFKLSFLLLLMGSTLMAQSQNFEECMDFLYASMSQPDKFNYTRDFYEENVKTTLQARNEMPWGLSIPTREFLHFVLPLRVKNEYLDSCRVVFYKELKDRIKHMSMCDAVLEINHWCHEKVTYTPSDERTSSPLSTIKTAFGRCGEESTLLVAALRAVGIPARQVYTPRWAHTDDNHAWVEAWVDGKWRFLGACEPEPVLDLGWFNAPASRGMLMHTMVFGRYDGPEEVMHRNDYNTEIDITSNYAPVARRQVKVVDLQNNPVAGATVDFKIYNYAEFYTVSSKVTDINGMSYMQAGIGDLIAWAHNDGQYGFAVCDISEDSILTIKLEHKMGDRFSADLKIVPPIEKTLLPTVTDNQREINNHRLKVEDSIRNSYVATFPQTDNIYIKKSRGNHKCIAQFLERNDLKFDPNDLLEVISEKDLRDVTIDVLLDANLTPHNNNTLEQSLYNNYVLNPRVAAEQLTPYKGYFLKQLTAKERVEFSDITKIIQWTKNNIFIDEKSNPQHLRMTPIGVWNSRVCDSFSRNIFFVALCRTMGHAARIDVVTQCLEYYYNGTWVKVNFDNVAESKSSKGTLVANFAPDEINNNPKYYYHFTLSKIINGVPVLLNYEDGDTWQSTLAQGVAVDEGDYLLVSGTRMADGSAIVHVEVAPVVCSDTTRVRLIMPKSNEGFTVIGSFNSENTYVDSNAGTKSLLSTTGRGYYVLGIISPNNEPTIHALRDIALLKNEFESINVPIVLLFKNPEEQGRFNVGDFPDLPQGTHLGSDIDSKIWNELSQAMRITSPVLPIFVIADTFNRIVFMSQGYTIGLGEQLFKNMMQLK